MKISVDRKFFSEQLGLVSKAISPQTTIPALTGIYLQVQPDRMILTGSDSDMSIQSTILPGELNQLVIEEPGEIIVEARYLNEIMKNMDCVTVVLETQDATQLTILTDNGKYTLNGYVEDQYPPVDFSRPTAGFTMDTEQLKKAVDQTRFACSDKDPRPVLGGVHFLADGETLRCSATDSYRLADKTMNFASDNPFDITIPARTLTEITRLPQNDLEKLEVYADRKRVQFIYDKTIIQSKLLEGAFPDVSRIIPSRFKAQLVINKEALRRAVDRVSFIRNEKQFVIKMSLSPEEVRLITTSQEIGESTEKLTGHTYTGEPLELTINGTYLSQAIRALDGENIVLRFSGNLSPLLITAQDDEQTRMVLVPIRSHY